MSAPDRHVIRSYQRIFKPDRRIYQVEGHQLPVPGGVPLAWLGYFIATLLAVLLLGSGSHAVGLVLAATTAVTARALGAGRTALLLGLVVLLASQAVGIVLSVIDWPLRLVVLPAAVATLATQATPDGRPAHRYVRSWLLLRLRPARRSLGRPLPPAEERRMAGGAWWVARDHGGSRLRRGRLNGPVQISFRGPVVVTGRRRRSGARRIVRPVPPGTPRSTAVLSLERGERLEVRP